MTVKFDMDEAYRAVNAYNEAITALKDYTNTIRDDYFSLRTVVWSGEAERAFMLKFHNEIYAVWEKLICQLEHTRDAIETTSRAAEPIKEQSDTLM